MFTKIMFLEKHVLQFDLKFTFLQKWKTWENSIWLNMCWTTCLPDMTAKSGKKSYTKVSERQVYITCVTFTLRQVPSHWWLGLVVHDFRTIVWFILLVKFYGPLGQTKESEAGKYVEIVKKNIFFPSVIFWKLWVER